MADAGPAMRDKRARREMAEKIMDKIQLEGVFNARDMGGIPVGGGKKVKSGRLIRSDALRDLTAEDETILRDEYGLARVIDLRTEKEIWEKPDPEIEGVKAYHIPLIKGGPAAHKVEPEKSMAQIFKESIEELNYDAGGAMKRMYVNLLSDEFSQNAIRQFFDVFLGCEEGATLFHCTAGKDRTGLIAILFLDAFGADREVIIRDYMSTNEHLKPQTEWIANEVAKTDDDPRLIEQVNVMNTVYPEYADAIFEKIDSFGGSRKYLTDVLGFSEEQLAELERLYLE
jgi:protein-tyrosine phosphatase